ncbi:hypothetical protein [Rugosimonospora africana]|uniref:Uncharacterized protein n=1 Tax=Rugosimonospora africana TaxID=556532 RepID=A0A8J3VTU3_9ACTN|nr:hypothetical protein [Rugosimonospora africana]GIH18399.1 hypothetical protein Raf01_65710 [Rugosimonospora africana]
MTDPLEGRYRRLLRSYPRAYRQERADEIVSTLMELAEPGQRHPTVREAAALVLGGLRARAGAHRRHTPGAVWAGALHLGVLFLLVDAGASALAQAIKVVVSLGGYPRPPTLMQWAYLATAVLIGVTVAAAASGRRHLALALTVLAIVAQHWAPDNTTMNDVPLISGVLWPLPLAAVGTAALLRRQVPAARHAMRWLIAIPGALIIMPTQLPVLFSPQSWAWSLFRHQLLLLLAALLACLLYGLVDARIPIAAGILMLGYPLAPVLDWVLTWPPGSGLSDWAVGVLLTYGAFFAATFAVGTLGARWQTRR